MTDFVSGDVRTAALHAAKVAAWAKCREAGHEDIGSCTTDCNDIPDAVLGVLTQHLTEGVEYQYEEADGYMCEHPSADYRAACHDHEHTRFIRRVWRGPWVSVSSEEKE